MDQNEILKIDRDFLWDGIVLVSSTEKKFVAEEDRGELLQTLWGYYIERLPEE